MTREYGDTPRLNVYEDIIDGEGRVVLSMGVRRHAYGQAIGACGLRVGAVFYDDVKENMLVRQANAEGLMRSTLN